MYAAKQRGAKLRVLPSLLANEIVARQTNYKCSYYSKRVCDAVDVLVGFPPAATTSTIFLKVNLFYCRQVFAV